MHKGRSFARAANARFRPSAFCLLPASFYYSRRSQQFALDFIEDAVDEFAAVLSGKFFRDIDGFIDADHWRDVIAMEHFINSQAQNIPVHGGDPMEVPVFGMLRDLLVQLGAMFDDAANQRLGELANLNVLRGHGPWRRRLSPGGGAFFFGENGGLL